MRLSGWLAVACLAGSFLNPARCQSVKGGSRGVKGGSYSSNYQSRESSRPQVEESYERQTQAQYNAAYRPSCDPPSPPMNGRLSCRQNENRQQQCVGSCMDGFKFPDDSESMTLECSMNGVWLPFRNFPDCVGSYSGSYGSAQQSSYISEYSHQSSSYGAYGGSSAGAGGISGRRVPCAPPKSPTNGRMSCSMVNGNWNCPGTCNPGFAFPDGSTQLTLTCSEADGVWNPQAGFPDCTALCHPPCQNGGRCWMNNECHCPPTHRGNRCQYATSLCDVKRFTANAVVRSNCTHLPTYTECHMSCPPGMEFKPPSSYLYRCTVDGHWNPPTSPQCASDSLCQTPPPPMNGNVRCRGNTEVMLCSASCTGGFLFPDGFSELTIQCVRRTGEWTPDFGFPNCEATCSPPCENGGKCLGHNSCLCPMGYRGGRCQYLTSLCDGHDRFASVSWKCSHGEKESTCDVSCAGGGSSALQPPQPTVYTCSLDGTWHPDLKPICVVDYSVIDQRAPEHERYQVGERHTREHRSRLVREREEEYAGQHSAGYRQRQVDYEFGGQQPVDYDFEGQQPVDYSFGGQGTGHEFGGQQSIDHEFGGQQQVDYEFGGQQQVDHDFNDRGSLNLGGYKEDRQHRESGHSNQGSRPASTGQREGKEEFGVSVSKGNREYEDRFVMEDKDASEIRNGLKEKEDGREDVFSKIDVASEYSGVCTSWGYYHFRSFDGGVFTLPSTCPYILASTCRGDDDQLTISLMTECDPHGPCLRTVGIQMRESRYTLSYETGLKQDGMAIPIPVQAGEMSVARVTRYIVARFTAGFTVWINEENTVLVVASPFLKRKACGLCGDFDGRPEAAFLRRDGVATDNVHDFANSWRRDQDGHCIDNVELRLPCSSDTKEKRLISDEANVVCAALYSAEFQECGEVVDPSLYYAKCQMDCCSTELVEGCECPSIGEFVFECSRNGLEMGEWRKPGLCPMRCDGGRVYKECGPPCPPTCDDQEPTCQQERCVDGCHCPEGTVLENDRCVAVEECPCHHGPKVYRSGERLQQDCNTCICEGGAWQCTDSTCPATCTVSGPHYTTFDGLSYDLYGMCSYYLVEAGSYNVQIEYSNNCRDQPTLTSVCVRSVTIQTEEGATVKLKQTMEVSVNGREMIGLPVLAPGIYVGQATSIYIRARLSNGLEVLWDMDASVQVHAPAALFGEVRGLCGTFTRSRQDDLLTPEGDVELTAEIFAPQWRVEECPAREDPRSKDDKPCDKYSNRRDAAARVCESIEGEDFEECHSVLDYQPYYEKCMEDVCACLTDPVTCTCLALSEYASACSRKGRPLTAWRQNAPQCGVPCPVGQVYQACADPCTYSCAEIAHSSECNEEACTEGCTCPPGQTLDAHHRCVQVSTCSCVHGGHLYPPEFMQRRGKEMCECSQGLWACHEATASDLILTPPPNVALECDPAANMEPTDCVSDCPVTCTTLHHHQPCTTAVCVPGCRCKKGYILDASSSRCVKPIDCPCHHSGKSYAEGEQVIMECHKCTCEGGVWNCPSDPCPAVCSAWGDSHFETFDGTLFDFVGPCDYVLTKAHLSDHQVFSVVVQNVPCGGAGGATCGKSVSVSLGHQTITMTKDHPLPEVPAKSRLSASSMGMFTLVDSDVGITVQWDRNSRVYVIAQPIWQDKLQGLCGDFNSDASDDFRGPSGGLPLVLAKDFADSWRVHKHCNPAVQPKNACDLNPERRTWSKHKCAVLKSELFEPCHCQVEVEEYYKRCVQDACACNSGGDCECMCAVVSAYAQKCARTGVVIPWRSQDLCPVQCESCDRYDPCISLCPTTTCDTYLEDSSERTRPCSRQPCVDGCEPKPCDPGHVHRSADNATCVPEEECEEKPCAVIAGVAYREGERIRGEEEAGDECQSCYCRKGAVECVGVPCTSTTPRPTLGYKSEACEFTGWTEWINSNDPLDTLGDESESLEDLISDRRIPCPLANVSAVQCRVADTQEPYQAAGQKVVCDSRKGLECRKTINSQMCKDYEIRVYCQCHHEVTCPPGQEWQDCAFLCSNVCHSMRTYLDEDDACSHGQTCVPGCVKKACRPPKMSRDAETCVTAETCTCRLGSGYVLAPGEVIADGCQKCQCLNNTLICSAVLDCSVTETEIPPAPPGVTEIEYVTPPLLCLTGWTQWQSLNLPNGDGERESPRELFEEDLLGCDLEQLVRLQCREAKTLRMVQRSGQDGVHCDVYGGLVCRNGERTPGRACPDFEIRAYCDCEVEVVPGWRTKVTTKAPIYVTQTVPEPRIEKFCRPGWTEWVNSHPPDKIGERETISSLVDDHLIGCDPQEITEIECREVGTQREVEGATDDVVCDLENGGLVCSGAYPEKCPDYEVRVYCECEPGKRRHRVKPGVKFPKTTTPETRHELVTVTMMPPIPEEEEGNEISPGLPVLRPTSTACSYWSDWINKGRPRRGKKHGDREDTKPYILKQTEGFCLEGTVSDIECRHVATDKDYRESGEERLVCRLDKGFQCQNRHQPDSRCDDYKIRYHCTCGEEERKVPLFIRTTTPGYIYPCTDFIPLIDGPRPLPDSSIKASSSASLRSGPDAVKMNNKGRKAWSPAASSAQQYVEVDLGKVRAVYGVVTKGREDSDEFVTSYQLLYSSDGVTYAYYQEEDKNKVFSGNYDDDVEVQHIFVHPFEARLVRLEPLTWEETISLRMELLGCAEAITTSTAVSTEGEEEEEEHEVLEKCRIPIGIESGDIADSRLSASSFYDPETSPQHGRMGSDTAWVAGHTDDQQYFQVEVSDEFTITGIVTRGRQDEPQWVRSYTVSYLDGERWREVLDEDGKIKEFVANSDQDTRVTNELPEPVDPDAVRILPASWKGWISMQVELLGCPRGGEEEPAAHLLPKPIAPKCQDPMGLENGLLLDSQLSASSSYNSLFTPEFARLAADSVWAAEKLDDEQYLQVDFIDPQNVSGIITKGREDVPQWVTAFEVEFSNDGNTFSKIKDKRGKVQEFSANYDAYRPVRNLFPATVRARFLRIRPTKWKNWISMQIEVLGCYHPQPCRDPMGVENGVVSNHQLTASSEAAPASDGRLSSVKAWSPEISDKAPYIQVDLLEPLTLNGVITKGNPEVQQWVETFQVSYSNDTLDWKKVENARGKAKDFQGNEDQDSPVINLFPFPFTARYVRVRPLAWHRTAAMRIELLGCYHERVCREPMGLENGMVSDSQISASSSSDYESTPGRARISGKGGWQPDDVDKHPYLQIDFLEPRSISGVVTKGKGDSASWVTRFKVTYSANRRQWYPIITEDGDDVVFQANKDPDTPVVNLFPDEAVDARFFRIVPLEFNESPGLRVELLGCYHPYECHEPMGMEDGNLLDLQLTASSYLDDSHSPASARLGSQTAWVIGDKDTYRYIQVDLIVSTNVTGLMMQGRNDADEWITEYKLQYSGDGEVFDYIKDEDGDPKVFDANYDSESTVTSLFPYAVSTRYLRVFPLRYHKRIALRFEVIGCSREKRCLEPMGLENGLLPDSHVSASSYKAEDTRPEYGRLNSEWAWSAKHLDKQQYLQVDFLEPRNVSAIVTKGSNTMAAWVTKYQVAVSEDGDVWTLLKDDEGEALEFKGNYENQDPVIRVLPETVETRLLRIIPTDWNKWISLRLEILGCYHPYEEPITGYVTRLPEIVLPMTGVPTEPIFVEPCPDPMEAESSLLVGSKITVSSSSPEGSPSRVALNTPDGGWVPRVDDQYPVLTVEFPQESLLTSIFIQGRGGKEENWVTSFRVVESPDNNVWMPVFGPDGREIIEGNSDKESVVGHYFKVPAKTRFVRIIPETWHRWPSFRMDLRGCRHLPGASTAAPAVHQLCPELAEYPELGEDCPQCPRGQLCDGQHCVDPVDCVCVHQGEIFKVGDRLEDRKCRLCDCALGGRTVCREKECLPCDEGDVSVLEFEDCSCSCKGCPEGLRMCPNSGECVPEQRWCDGIVDCPDDETDCEETSTPPAGYTTEQPPVPLGRYTTTAPHIPPGLIVSTLPPPTKPGNATCDVVGRHINTFDGQDVLYEVCHHVVMKDVKLGKFNVTLHKECGYLSECRSWLEVGHRKHHLVVQAGSLRVEVDGHPYTGAQLWRLRRKSAIRNLAVSKAGEQVRIQSLYYGFTVTYDVRGRLKIEVVPELQKKISGLCGYYSGEASDDQRKPNGKRAYTAQEFGDSWAVGGRDSCAPLICPHEQMTKAIDVCHKLRDDPFVPCGQVLPLNQFLELCMSSTCECLLGTTRKKKTEEGEEQAERRCKCEAFLPFVEACEAELGPLAIRNWRVIHECHTECPPGMEWQDCGPSCQLTCETAGVDAEGQSSSALAEECSSERCVPGCFCPPGTVLNEDQCIPPDQCADQVCRGFGDPHFRTFDGLFFPFQATGSFLIVGDKHNDIAVSGLSKKCGLVNPNTCLVGLEIQYKGHTISIQKKKDLKVDGREIPMDQLPLHEDGLVILGYPGRTFVVVIPAIRFEARYYEENSGFAVKVPSRRYFNKTEGLCGNCNGRRDDELKEEPINEYVCSWKTDGDKEDCVESLEELPEIEIRLPICDKLEHPVFGGCHALVDVEVYVDACNFDAAHSGDEQASLCKTAMEYGRQCCQAGVDVAQWPAELGCDIDCPTGTRYESCHRGCPQTCSARNNRTFSPDEDCARTKADGCFCPEGEVLKADACVPASHCDTCDEEGHVAGDEWRAGPCKLCECREDLTVECVLEKCPARPICSVREQLTKRENQIGDSCCDDYVCVPKEEDCPAMEVPRCRKGEAAKVHTGFLDHCPRFKCECDPVLCPALVWPDDLEEGQRSVLFNDSCCPAVKVVCEREECPEKPDCPRGTELLEIEGECCDIYKCRPPKGACAYGHSFKVENGIQSLLEQLEVEKTIYQPGDEWEDGLCVKCSCVESNGQFASLCRTETCPELDSMLDNKNYVLQEVKVPGKCCPDVFKIQCRDEDGNVYGPGEEWQDGDDSCISFLCEHVEDGSVVITKSVATCSECPRTAVLFPPSQALGQCCGTCKITRCEDGDDLYPVGETWTPTGDACKVAECVSEFGDVRTVYTRQPCPILPDDCPEDKIIWDNKGCCQVCNLTSELACSTGPIPEEDTIGFFTIHDPLRDWICVNDKPVKDVLQCKGACHSREYYSLEDGDFKEMCQCCKVDVVVDRIILLRCPDGSYIRKKLLQPQSCKCSKCAPKDQKTPSQQPWVQRNTGDDDAFVFVQTQDKGRYGQEPDERNVQQQEQEPDSWSFQQQEQEQYDDF